MIDIPDLLTTNIYQDFLIPEMGIPQTLLVSESLDYQI